MRSRSSSVSDRASAKAPPFRGAFASSLVVGLLGLLALSACGDVEVPPFPDGQGQKHALVTYPPGPYGVSKGQVITNYQFHGFPRPADSADPNALQPISLSDFYNPSGNELFGEGSPYGEGNPKPKALLIDIGAVWCGPCKQEAMTDLPPAYQDFHPGAEFLFILSEGLTSGVPATPKELVNWVTVFKSLYPSALDQDRQFVSVFNTSSFPVNLIVDTETMKIVEVLAGKPEAGGPFYDVLQATIDG
jgi:hypothetical protein